MFWEPLRELSLVSIALRIGMALLVGGLLGIERGRQKRPAGLRTYMLVCLGSMLVMMTNQYVHIQHSGTDLVRMGAQVISGIGFLGAGTIMVTGRNQVKGITTAAGMWAAACCGLAIGAGFYEGALMGAFAVWVVMVTMRRLDGVIHRHSSSLEVYIELDSTKPLSEFLTYVRQQKFDVQDIQMMHSNYAKHLGECAIFTLESQVKRSHREILNLVENAPGVRFLEEL